MNTHSKRDGIKLNLSKSNNRISAVERKRNRTLNHFNYFNLSRFRRVDDDCQKAALSTEGDQDTRLLCSSNRARKNLRYYYLATGAFTLGLVSLLLASILHFNAASTQTSQAIGAFSEIRRSAIDLTSNIVSLDVARQREGVDYNMEELDFILGSIRVKAQTLETKFDQFSAKNARGEWVVSAAHVLGLQNGDLRTPLNIVERSYTRAIKAVKSFVAKAEKVAEAHDQSGVGHYSKELLTLYESQTKPLLNNSLHVLTRRSELLNQVLTSIAWGFSALLLILCAAVILLVLRPMEKAIARQFQQLLMANRRAQSADRAKSEFLANMSHEIRTPMNGVMGMAELLSKTGLNAKQKTYMDIIIKSGNALLTIINDILDFSKLEAEQMVLDIYSFRLVEAVEDVATLVSSQVIEKDLELIVRVDPELPQLMFGDAGRLRQVITNLVGNAVKFTEKGHIYVNVHGHLTNNKSGKSAADSPPVYALTFEIEDTGIGIPEEKVESIFGKFSQVDSSANRRHEGTGLGLAISASLIRLMGGEIGVKSRPGEGSTFWFEIELPADPHSASPEIAPHDLSGSRILVIDDNAVNRSILEEQLSNWSFDAAACSSGQEALRFLEAAHSREVEVDCIILDYHMPQMTGEEVVKQLKADARFADIPIVMLTSVEQTADGASLLSLGIDAHVTKPARSAVLLQNITHCLQGQSGRLRSGSRKIPVGIEVARKFAASNERFAGISVVAQNELSAAPPNGNKNAPGADLASLDVLVCEDNEVNQIVFAQILEGMKLNYKIARNGKIGVSLYKHLNPRLVLMDVSMPEMNGLDATRAIREIEKEKSVHTPIIGVTAHAIKGDRERCIEAGMNDYLSKPVSPGLLTEKINQWMEGKAERLETA